MRISTIFYFYSVLGLMGALTVFGVFSYRRDVAQFEEDMRRDAQVLGRALSSAASAIWFKVDESSAREMVADSAAGESRIRIRWVSPDSVSRTEVPWAHLEESTELTQTVVIREAGEQRAGLYTYVPLRGPTGQVAALELYEPWADLSTFASSNAVSLAWMSGALVVLGSVLFGAIGHWSIGRRVTALRRHTIEIAQGKLDTRVAIGGQDELGDLGKNLNQMAIQLEQSKNGLLAEHESHLKTVEQLRHADRVSTLGRLSAGMAHELGTPLNVIAGRAKLIGQMDESREVVDSARIIADQADRITGIVRAFLDFGRRSALRKTSQDIHELLTHVREMLTPFANTNQVAIVLTQAAIPPRLMLDERQMQQVFTNMITNAIHAMPDGGTVDVVIDQKEAERESEFGLSPAQAVAREWVTVRIEDEGVGMSAEEMEQAFEPFFTTKPVGRSTGLGLSIAAGIVEDHGGWIAVRSEKDRGSCFVVHLPVEADS